MAKLSINCATVWAVGVSAPPLRSQRDSIPLTTSSVTPVLLSDTGQVQTQGFFWHHSSPLTQSFGTSTVSNMSTKRFDKTSISRVLSSLEERWECEQTLWKRIWLDDRLHADQLWREDSRGYSVVQILLELQQLAHEVEVGGDDGPPGFDELVGVRHGHPGVLHQVGDHNGGGARHAGLAVDQKAQTCLMCFLCREEEKKSR